MAKIAVIIDDWFEDSEYSKPVQAFIDKGDEIFNIGLQKGKVVTGKRQDVSVEVDVSVNDVRVGDFDALLIPGGFSPDKLRAYPEPVKFAGEFVKSGKPVFVICHGPQLLISANVLQGRNITGWKSIAQDIVNAGAVFADKEVIVDDNIVSSRSPRDLPAFIRESIAKIHSPV